MHNSGPAKKPQFAISQPEQGKVREQHREEINGHSEQRWEFSDSEKKNEHTARISSHSGSSSSFSFCSLIFVIVLLISVNFYVLFI